MPFITRQKTNWRFIGIVLVLAVIVGGGIWFWMKTQEIPLVEVPEIEEPEEPVISKEEITEEVETTEEVSDIIPEIKFEYTIPEELEKALLLAIENRYGYSGIKFISFPREGAVTSVDLNNDGEREFILDPIEVYTKDGSERYFLAGPANFPIYIYQKRDGVWNEIFYGYGMNVSFLEDTTNGYHDIELDAKMGFHQYVIKLYQWQETESKYKFIESREERVDWE